MKIGSLDIGKKKTGISWGYLENEMIFPGTLVIYKTPSEALEKIEKILKQENIKKVVVGIPHSERSDPKKSFQYDIGTKLSNEFEVEFIDESFSSLEGREMLSEFGIKNRNEDIEASMIILKRYLYNQKESHQ